MNAYERGTCRLGVGLIGVLGMAGGAEHGAPGLSVLLGMVAFALVGAWGAGRMNGGPSLPRLGSWWRSSRLNPVNWAGRRHALIFLRAARR